MDYTGIAGMTPEAHAFIKEWFEGGEYVIAHTSGSTGAPKEIRLLKRDMVASARATNEFFGISSSSVMGLPLSASYIAGKMMIVRSIVAGCRIHIARPGLNPLDEFPGDVRFDLLPIVPGQIEGLLSATDVCGRVAAVIVGGAPMSTAQEAALAASGIRAYATYGMTETCSHVALRRIGAEDFFTALPGISFDTDSRGCLVINAPGFSFGKITTNDCVTLLSPSRFRWLGRADNVINSGGIKVHPEELEQTLAPLLGDRAVFVTSRSSDRWGSEIILCVEGQGFNKDAFFAGVSKLLPRKLMPKEVVEIDCFKRTMSGKIIRER
ncbi:MAG: AMP-binding protein [Paramuribaculum sp.]|nr:AMP-binding protein [Paramuribaculum sp.]